MKNLKEKKKFELKLGTSRVRFLSCYGQRRHDCYGNILISYKNWTQTVKKRTNFSSKVVSVGLDFSAAMGTAMVAVQIFKIFCKITSIKK